MKAMNKLFVAAVIAISLAACQQETFEGRQDSGNFYASVETFATGTKTALGENRAVVWSSEDRIAIFEGKDVGQAYQVLDSYVGKSSGEFAEVEGLVTEGTDAAIEGSIAVYPFNEALTVTSGDNGDYIIEGITFPSEQRYVAGSFSDEAFPMVAVTSDKNLSFKNVGGVLKLSLTGSYSVSQITLTGNSGEPLSGSATVTLGSDGIPSVTMSDDASTSVTLVCDPAVQLDPETATDFYISIPPTAFKGGFNISVIDTKSNLYKKSTNLSNPVLRSIIHKMPVIDPSEHQLDGATENYIDLGIGTIAQITEYNDVTGNVSLEYNTTIPIIKAGKSFVMPVDLGASIRVINEYQVSGNTVTLQTAEGNMCDLFKNTSFTLATSTDIDTKSAGEWNVITPSACGFIDDRGVYQELYNSETFTRSLISYPEFVNEQDLWTFNKDFSRESLISGELGNLYWEKCSFDALLKAKFQFNFGEKNNIGDIKYFSYTLYGSYNIDMLLAYECVKAYSEEENDLIKRNIIKPLLFRFVVGNVPVILQVDTHLGKKFEFLANGEVKASFGVNVCSEIEMGAEWTPEHGIEFIKDIKHTNTLYDPIMEIKASAEAKVSYYPHIDIKLYNFVGTWLEPQPYLSEQINAGVSVTTGNGSTIGWKSHTSAGIDLKTGLDLNFFGKKNNIFQKETQISNYTLLDAPVKISKISPMDEVENIDSTTAEFLVEAYSPISDSYYPCPGALVKFDVSSGVLSSSFAVADMTGKVHVDWKSNKADSSTNNISLTAKIADDQGKAIDEASLIIKKSSQLPTIKIENIDVLYAEDQGWYQDPEYDYVYDHVLCGFELDVDLSSSAEYFKDKTLYSRLVINGRSTAGSFFLDSNSNKIRIDNVRVSRSEYLWNYVNGEYVAEVGIDICTAKDEQIITQYPYKLKVKMEQPLPVVLKILMEEPEIECDDGYRYEYTYNYDYFCSVGNPIYDGPGYVWFMNQIDKVQVESIYEYTTTKCYQYEGDPIPEIRTFNHELCCYSPNQNAIFSGFSTIVSDDRYMAPGGNPYGSYTTKEIKFVATLKDGTTLTEIVFLAPPGVTGE